MTPRLPIPRTSFLDSRLRLRGRVNRLAERSLNTSDAQLDPIAHVGKPGGPLTAAEPRERSDQSA
ncbi:MAG: hypothetical protein AAGI52_05685 [Bacteroidota bacterium]